MAPDKPIICYQRRSSISREASDSSYLRLCKTRSKLTHSEVLSPCDGRKRLRFGEKKAVTLTLPEDVLYTEILTRLPTKHIRRCRLVCKSWNSLFSTSDFVNLHLKRQLNHEEDDRIIVKRFNYLDEGIRILSHTNEIIVSKVPCVCDTLLGSINGLICMATCRGRRFCLWNPAIAQVNFFDLPPPHFHPGQPKCFHYLGGFCWDHVRNDYKVLIFCYEFIDAPPSQLCIYSTNSATWTPLRIPQNPRMPEPIYDDDLMAPPSTIVKGTPYWSYSKYLSFPGKKNRRKSYFGFKFVPQVNEFRLLPHLDTLKLRAKNFNLVNIKDRLVGMAYKSVVYAETLVDIYYLDDEEDSSNAVWSKMYTIGPIYFGSMYQLSQCFRIGGEVLVRGFCGPFSFYVPKTKETKTIAESRSNCFGQCYSYTPSLVCVQGMESLQSFSTKEGSRNTTS